MFLVILVKWKILGRSGKQKRGKSHSVGHTYWCWSADSDFQVEIALDWQLLKLLLDSSTVSLTPGPGVCVCVCACVCVCVHLSEEEPWLLQYTHILNRLDGLPGTQEGTV